MSVRFPRLAAAALLLAGAITVGIAAPAFAENSPTSVPIANPDSYSMMGGTTLTVDFALGLLANDLHASEWTTINIVGVQNDVAGELVLDGTKGMFAYTPDPAFVGVRTFEYQLFDGDLGTHSDWGLVTITVLDPTLPCLIGTPGCEAPDPDPAPGDTPCLIGTPGCIPADLPPCDPNGPVVAAPGPGEPATCIPGEPTPGDGSDLPCAVGTPGCPPPAILPCDPNALPQEAGNSVPCIPVDLDIPTPTSGDGGTTSTTQLPTLAYTGATVDFRLAGLAALLLVGGVILVVPRRRA
jgi:hypothetical protein